MPAHIYVCKLVCMSVSYETIVYNPEKVQFIDSEHVFEWSLKTYKIFEDILIFKGQETL